MTIGENNGNKYFGTDGFRGEANLNLTSIQAYKVGRFLGWYSLTQAFYKSDQKPRILIGKDTRRSSYMLEYSIVAGMTASGVDAYMLHVTTTPSISYVTRQDEFDFGIMITASHNPYYDNGIKIINRYGEKIDDTITEQIENYLDGNLAALGIADEDLPLAKREKIGSIIDYVSGRNRYLGYLISIASNSYKRLRIGIDSANGASWMIAKSVFDALGAQTFVIGAEPNGFNINNKCGSTHPDNLSALVRSKHLDIGFAFDGDADRCIAVDENGKIVDGDAIMYILAKRLMDRGMLNENTLVCTTMSNSGMIDSLEKLGISAVKTNVGDRYVYECMQQNDYSLGGEQSGHIIIKKYATTGDGILTAIMLCEEICDRKTTLSKLAEPIHFYPQKCVSAPVKDKKSVIEDADIKKERERIEKIIDGKGRTLLRESGTEPVVRIMIECDDLSICDEFTENVLRIIKEKGYSRE